MITIKQDGKIIVPCDEAYIGHAGDNLSAVKEFFVEEVSDISLVYRMYLLFDDGTTNFFLLDSEVIEGGTKLTWNVTSDQIYKDGVVKMQIKASNSSGLVFHSDETSVIVNTSIEFSEAYGNKENSEFLYHEKYLNELLEKEKDIVNQLLEIPLDTEPKEGSTFGITSGAVYKIYQTVCEHNYANEQIKFAIRRIDDSIAQLQESLSDINEQLEIPLDTQPVKSSTNGITSGAVYVVDDKVTRINSTLTQAMLDISNINETISQIQADVSSVNEKLEIPLDTQPVKSSSNGITSGAVYVVEDRVTRINSTLIQAMLDISNINETISQIQADVSSVNEKLEIPLDTEPVKSSTNGITSGAVYVVEDRVTRVISTLIQVMLDINRIDETLAQIDERISALEN